MLISLLPFEGSADIYSHIDEDGVVHFTNAPRPGRKWTRIRRTGPGKARVVHAIRRRALSAERYRRYDALIAEAAELYEIPQALIRAVIRVESDYDKRAVSRVGACGLMQLMPRTAREMGVEAIFDPRQNIMGGTRLLRVLANRFRGDIELTLAGYHAGAGAVAKYGNNNPPVSYTQLRAHET